MALRSLYLGFLDWLVVGRRRQNVCGGGREGQREETAE